MDRTVGFEECKKQGPSPLDVHILSRYDNTPPQLKFILSIDDFHDILD